MDLPVVAAVDAMRTFSELFHRVDPWITAWMARYGIIILRVALGVVFFWFGVLKFLPGLSPAQELATRTIDMLTFGLIGAGLSLPVLAAWECAIGLGLVSGRFLRLTLLLLFLQMPGTMLPVVFFPAEVFLQFPFVPTLEGQYIIKNFVLIGAALVIGATVRGGRVIADPEAARVARSLEERHRQPPRFR